MVAWDAALPAHEYSDPEAEAVVEVAHKWTRRVLSAHHRLVTSGHADPAAAVHARTVLTAADAAARAAPGVGFLTTRVAMEALRQTSASRRRPSPPPSPG